MRNKTFIISTLQNPHFWAIAVVTTFLMYFYQLWPWREWEFSRYFVQHVSWLSSLRELAIFESIYRIIGTLFLFPIIYATVIFKWKGALIASLLSFMSLFPQWHGYWRTPESWITNISIMLLPMAVIMAITIELELRRKDKKIFIEREKERRLYTSKIIEAQENERQRIAQELHDGSIQTILALATHMDALEVTDNIEEIRHKARWIKTILRDTVEDLRRITLDLRPDILDSLGLIPAIKWLIERAKIENRTECELSITGERKRLNTFVELTIFRVIQEALNNIRRHAKANQVKIMLIFNKKFLDLKIIDNGCGFIVPDSLSGLAEHNKLGLLGIQQRVKSVGGNFKIKSSRGTGTQLQIIIPYSDNKHNTLLDPENLFHSPHRLGQESGEVGKN